MANLMKIANDHFYNHQGYILELDIELCNMDFTQSFKPN